MTMEFFEYPDREMLTLSLADRIAGAAGADSLRSRRARDALRAGRHHAGADLRHAVAASTSTGTGSR